MKFGLDNSGNKIITIQPIYADDQADKFKYLHTKGLLELDEHEELSNIHVKPEISSPSYLIIEYKDPLKPNVLFKFSKGLKERMESGEDEHFLLDCQFWYYKDSDGIGHIRFARPLEFDSLIDLVPPA